MRYLSKHHLADTELKEEFLLVESAKKDVSNFKPLYDKYFSIIKECVANTLYTRYTIRNEELIKDLTSSVFEKALSNLGKFNSKGVPFKSWLYKIMQNEINDYIRRNTIVEKHQIRIEQTLQRYDEIALLEVVHHAEEKHIGYLRQYIPRLNDVEQQLIQYRFFCDYSYKQISQLMGMRENNLRTRMNRVLKKIQVYIEAKAS